jgi:chromosome segregation ATPase
VQVEAAHAPCESQTATLKAHLARLDSHLHEEIEKEHALERQVAAEKKKEQEIEDSLRKKQKEFEINEEAWDNDRKLLAAMRAELDALQKSHDALKLKYAPCPGIIARLQSDLDALRRQIKETKDAVDKPMPKLLEVKNTVQTETADRQEKLKARVKLGASAPPKGGALHGPAASGSKPLPEFGAMDLDGDGMLSKQEFQSRLRIMEWSLEEAEKTFKALDRDGDGGISASEYAAFCQMEDKNLEFETLDGIAKLRQQLANLQARLAAVASKDASKDAEIEDLKKRLAEMTAAKELLARTCAAHEATLTDRDAEIQTLKKLVAEIKNIINSKVSKPVPVLCHSSDVPCDWFRLCVTLKC